MHHFRVLRAISQVLGLVFVLVALSLPASSCATGKFVSDKNQAPDADFELTAESVPEGLLLTFSNIPSDASYLWIHVYDWFNTEEPVISRNLVSSYAGITDTSVQGWVHATQQLEKVKQTGNVIFPFVQAGQKYRISVMVYNQQDYELLSGGENFRPCMAETECIAENGIYFDRDFVKIELGNDNSSITLTSEPVFSSEVTFAAQKYTYGVTIPVSETGSVGVADHHVPDGLSPDGLTWTFEPQMTRNLRSDSEMMKWLKAAIITLPGLKQELTSFMMILHGLLK